MCNFLNLLSRVRAEPFFGLFLLSEAKSAARNMSPCVHAKRSLTWQLQIRALMPDRRHGQGTGTWSFLQFPGMMVTSAYVESECLRKAASASVAGLGIHQWQRQLQLLWCHGVLQPWVVLMQEFAGLSRELGSNVRFHHTDFYLQLAVRPRLNLQLTVPLVRVLTLFVNSLKSAWKMRTVVRYNSWKPWIVLFVLKLQGCNSEPQ